MLSGAIGGVVNPEELIWEPSSGAASDLLLGRRVLFLGANQAGGARDVFRARVRVTLDGQPLSIGTLHNVTDTPVGDDAALEARGDRATFATLAFGRIQGLSVLDLSGIPRTDRPERFFDRLLLAINSYQATGSFAGLGRTNIVLDQPAPSAKLTLDPPNLEIDFGDAPRALRYQTEQRSLRASDGGEPLAARAVPEVHLPKPLVLWLVDTVRAEVGRPTTLAVQASSRISIAAAASTAAPLAIRMTGHATSVRATMPTVARAMAPSS